MLWPVESSFKDYSAYRLENPTFVYIRSAVSKRRRKTQRLKSDKLTKRDFHPTARTWSHESWTHKRRILQLMSGLKGKGEGKAWLSLCSSGVSLLPSASCHVGRVWMSTNWERAPRGSIPPAPPPPELRTDAGCPSTSSASRQRKKERQTWIITLHKVHFI